MTTKGIIKQLNFLCDFGIFRKVNTDNSYEYINYDGVAKPRMIVSVLDGEKLYFNISIFCDNQRARDIDISASLFKNRKEFNFYLSELIQQYCI